MTNALFEDELLTPEEVATKFKVHLVTIYRWIDSGVLKAAKIGDRWRIRQSDLDDFWSNKQTTEE